ncbi:M56 family metallopeptidase [Roseateles sp.]|uniref:M56 family metallopeptidase n=1 Tax=Roseateles sp. TaxID=1971397 RepID=UPI0039EBD4C6
MSSMLSTLMFQTLAVSAAVAMAALLRRPLARAFDARAAYLLWLCVPVALIVAPLPSPLHLSEPQRAALQEWVTPTQARAAAMALPVPPEAAPTWPQRTVAGWATGALLMALMLGLRQHRFGRQLRAVPDCTHLQLPAGASACVVGVLPARLALPADFEQRFSAEERELILAHEGVHLRRQDNLWNLLATLCYCLQWFNPLCWWAWRRMRADQELACDAVVLIERNVAADLGRYAQALIRSHDQANRALLPTLTSSWSSRSGLVERVAQLQAHAARRGQPRRDPAVIAALVLATAGAVSATAATQSGGKPPNWLEQLADPLPADLGDHPEPTILRWRMVAREGNGSMRHSTKSMPLMPGHLPASTKSRYVESNKSGPQWCLEVTGTRSADGSWRSIGQLLDSSCRQALDEPAPLAADGSVRTFNGRLPDGRPLVVELSAERFALPPQMVWVDVGIDHNLTAVSSPGMRLLGEQGTRMSIQTHPKPEDKAEALAVDIVVTTEGDDRARLKTRLLVGEPRRLLAEPEVVTRWGEPATIIWQDPAGEQRVELRLTPYHGNGKP